VVSEQANSFCFMCMSSTRSAYRELGLELVFLEDGRSCHPNMPPMVEEKRNEEEEDPIKLFLMEALVH
jgi:hypothetical protein